MPRTRSIAWAELKIGIAGVLAIGLASALILAVGGQGGFFWQRFPIRTIFDDVQGMKTGAIVRVAGTDVGKVTSVEFAGARVEVGMEVSRDVRPLITDQSVASLGTLSLLGEPIVLITAAPEGTPVADGDLLRSSESAGAIADAASAAAETLEQGQQLLRDIRAGRGSMGKLMTDDTLYTEMTALATSAGAITKQLSGGQGTFGALLQNPDAYNSMKASLDDLQGILTRIRQGEGALGMLMNDPAMSKSLAGTTANMEAVTGRLNRGEGTLGKLLASDELYARIDGLMTRFDRVITGLSSGEGTAGQLLQDAELYDNMNAAAESLNKSAAGLSELLTEIKKDPRKYLTVRVSIFGG